MPAPDASPPVSFLSSKWTILVALIRLALLFSRVEWNEPRIENVLFNPALQSILVRPTSTLDYWQELQAQYSLLETIPEEFKRKPILYQFIVPFIAQLGKQLTVSFTSIILAITLLVVDFLIAWFTEQLGMYLLQLEHMDREEIIQNNTPLPIRPNRAAIFDVSWKEHTTAAISRTQFPTLGAFVYFCSPLTILSGTQLSFQSLVYLGAIWSCYECSRPKGNMSWAAIVLASTAYIEPFVIVMVIPCYLLMNESKYYALCVTGYFILLHMLSFLLVGTLTFNIELPSYSHPNLGPLWYFAMQVFPRFRPYFQIMFFGLPYLLVIPLAIRLYRYPLVLATCYWCVFTSFHSHPTTQDFTIALALMTLSPRSLARTSLPSVVSLCALPVPMLLYLLDCWMWLETGSGNANFIFFQCLAYQVFVASIFIDFCGASVKRDKALRMTLKLALQQMHNNTDSTSAK